MKKITEKMAEFFMEGKGCFTVWQRVIRVTFFLPFICWVVFVVFSLVAAYIPVYIATGKDILE